MILASCDRSVSIFRRTLLGLCKFHVVFYSSTLIRLDKDAFKGDLCQTVNNFVKQNKLSLLSPLRKRRPSQLIKHIRNTKLLEYLEYLLLTNLAARCCTLSILSLLYFCYGSQTMVPYSIKERTKEK